MSKTPNYDAKVKVILDDLKPGERTCEKLGIKWMMDEEEIAQYHKYNVPPSKYAPLTRMKLLNCHIVMFDMWYNAQPSGGKPLISVIHPASGIRVLPDDEWFKQDFTSHGRDLDFSRSFIDQLFELSLAVPRSANLNYVQPENSLAFISRGDQNSYFVLACKSKNSVFSMNVSDMEDSAEVALSSHISRSYNIIHSQSVADCLYLRECLDCLSSAFLFDCRNCEFCFGATNKRNAKYLWWNEQLTEAEWKKRRAEVDLSSYAIRMEHEEHFRDMIARAIWPENWNVHAEGATGEYIYNSTRVHESFYICKGCADLEWVDIAYGEASNDCYMCAAVVGASDCYYGVGNGYSSKTRYSLSLLTRCLECEFSHACMDCENCFGCFGLRHKKFCILNKQYAEDEYWKTVDALKCAMLERGEYGDLPSAKFSTQHWSGCGAFHIYDTSKEELLKLGMPDVDVTSDGAEGAVVDVGMIHATNEIPDRADDAMTKTVYRDDVSGRRFSYLVPELAIYRALKIAPPRSHATRRLMDLYAELNLAVTDEDACAKCGVSVRVARNKVYPKRTVYCKACYFAYLEQHG